jgi:4-oxalocrotonate tautomerase
MPFVQVTMVRGRAVEQKRALIAAVSTAVAESTGTPGDRIRVAIYEVGPEEWASAASRTRWRGPRRPPAVTPVRLLSSPT